MTQPPDPPAARRNRTGCLIIVAMIALFVTLYFAVGLAGEPRNEVSEDIPTMPAN